MLGYSRSRFPIYSPYQKVSYYIEVPFLFPLQNLHHMFRAYGGWTFAFKDYLDMNITMYLDDPRMEQLAAIVDPYCKLHTLCASHDFLHLILCHFTSQTYCTFLWLLIVSFKNNSSFLIMASYIYYYCVSLISSSFSLYIYLSLH